MSRSPDKIPVWKMGRSYAGETLSMSREMAKSFMEILHHSLDIHLIFTWYSLNIFTRIHQDNIDIFTCIVIQETSHLYTMCPVHVLVATKQIRYLVVQELSDNSFLLTCCHLLKLLHLGFATLLSFISSSSTFSLVPGHFPSLSSTETRFQPKPSWLPLSPFEHISTSSLSSLFKLFSVFSSSSRPSLPEITKTGNANRKTTRQPICSITNSRERLLRMKERSGSLYKHGEKKKVKMRIFIFSQSRI